MNEEFLVVAGHQPATTLSLLFVHTARRSYRLGLVVRKLDVRLVGNRRLSRRLSNRSV